MPKTTHNRTITKADIAAAAKLKAVWAARAKSLGLTQEAIGAELDITQGAVSQYLNGKISMNYRTLAVFCRALGIDPADIRNDLPEQQLMQSSASEGGWEDIRGVRQAAALGDGSFVDEYAETHKLKFRTSSLRKQGLREDRLVVYYGDGESMEPRIRHGDALLFDTGDKRPVDGAIYLFSSPDTGLTVKRLVDYGGRWFLEADNKHARNWSKPVPMDGERHHYTIEGKLRWIGSWEG